MDKAPRDRLDELATAYQGSQILLTASRLGLFSTLGQETRTADELATALEASPRGIRILCDALVSLGLLEAAGGGYCNAELTVRHLLPDSPEPRADMLRHSAKLYARWGYLLDAVKSGAPVPDERLDPSLVGDERQFARAMADSGRRSVAATLRELDLTGVETMLDVGGGPGIYAIGFAQESPDLEVTIMDSEESLAVAHENIAAAGLTERIHLQPGDAFRDHLGGPYDLVLVSNVIHIYSPERNRQLVQRCAESLQPGGRLVLKDFFLDDDRQRPVGGVLFAVNMLVSTEGGDCYTVTEARSWIESAGLEWVRFRDVASRSRLLISQRRPELET